MPVNLASPGIVVREVDLTVGRVDATNGAVGALVAPFEKGAVGVPVLVSDESDLLANFGAQISVSHTKQTSTMSTGWLRRHIWHMAVICRS
jgi:hypothetical protein